MSYLCKKAVKLFGKPYQPGDIIPAESVLSTRVRALITCGYIAEATEEPADHNDEPKEVKTEAKGRASFPYHQGRKQGFYGFPAAFHER
jgi:hypothetical protein